MDPSERIDCELGLTLASGSLQLLLKAIKHIRKLPNLEQPFPCLIPLVEQLRSPSLFSGVHDYPGLRPASEQIGDAAAMLADPKVVRLEGDLMGQGLGAVALTPRYLHALCEHGLANIGTGIDNVLGRVYTTRPAYHTITQEKNRQLLVALDAKRLLYRGPDILPALFHVLDADTLVVCLFARRRAGCYPLICWMRHAIVYYLPFPFGSSNPSFRALRPMLPCLVSSFRKRLSCSRRPCAMRLLSRASHSRAPMARHYPPSCMPQRVPCRSPSPKIALCAPPPTIATST